MGARVVGIRQKVIGASDYGSGLVVLFSLNITLTKIITYYLYYVYTYRAQSVTYCPVDLQVVVCGFHVLPVSVGCFISSIHLPKEVDHRLYILDETSVGVKQNTQ